MSRSRQSNHRNLDRLQHREERSARRESHQRKQHQRQRDDRVLDRYDQR